MRTIKMWWFFLGMVCPHLHASEGSRKRPLERPAVGQSESSKRRAIEEERGGESSSLSPTMSPIYSVPVSLLVTRTSVLGGTTTQIFEIDVPYEQDSPHALTPARVRQALVNFTGDDIEALRDGTRRIDFPVGELTIPQESVKLLERVLSDDVTSDELDAQRAADIMRDLARLALALDIADNQKSLLAKALVNRILKEPHLLSKWGLKSTAQGTVQIDSSNPLAIFMSRFAPNDFQLLQTATNPPVPASRASQPSQTQQIPTQPPLATQQRPQEAQRSTQQIAPSAQQSQSISAQRPAPSNAEERQFFQRLRSAVFQQAQPRQPSGIAQQPLQRPPVQTQQAFMQQQQRQQPAQRPIQQEQSRQPVSLPLLAQRTQSLPQSAQQSSSSSLQQPRAQSTAVAQQPQQPTQALQDTSIPVVVTNQAGTYSYVLRVPYGRTGPNNMTPGYIQSSLQQSSPQGLDQLRSGVRTMTVQLDGLGNPQQSLPIFERLMRTSLDTARQQEGRIVPTDITPRMLLDLIYLSIFFRPAAYIQSAIARETREKISSDLDLYREWRMLVMENNQPARPIRINQQNPIVIFLTQAGIRYLPLPDMIIPDTPVQGPAPRVMITRDGQYAIITTAQDGTSVVRRSPDGGFAVAGTMADVIISVPQAVQSSLVQLSASNSYLCIAHGRTLHVYRSDARGVWPDQPTHTLAVPETHGDIQSISMSYDGSIFGYAGRTRAVFYTLAEGGTPQSIGTIDVDENAQAELSVSVDGRYLTLSQSTGKVSVFEYVIPS